MIDMLHSNPPSACHGVAFRITERPERGTVIDLTTIRLLDGTTPLTGDFMRCGTCGTVIDPASITPNGGWAKHRYPSVTDEP